jgi:hypothetical protein
MEMEVCEQTSNAEGDAAMDSFYDLPEDWSFDDLPEELIEYVFLHLSPYGEIQACKLVNI